MVQGYSLPLLRALEPDGEEILQYSIRSDPEGLRAWARLSLDDVSLPSCNRGMATKYRLTRVDGEPKLCAFFTLPAVRISIALARKDIYDRGPV
jgi:hypothetical protein